MKDLGMMVGLSFARKNRSPRAGSGQPYSTGDELSRIRAMRVIKRQATKPKVHRLDPYREQLVRRAQMPYWSSRDLAEWLFTETQLRVHHTTIWRYLKRQPELADTANKSDD